MRNRKASLVALIILIALSIPLMLLAGDYGKIKGRVTDKKTGDPIAGVSVLLVGTTQGAVTDTAGRFIIPLVRPGKFNLRITSINYNKVEIMSVTVAADLSTEVNIEMEKSVNDLGTITVTANRDIIDKYCTSSSVKISGDIRTSPVRNVDQLLQQSTRLNAPSIEEAPNRGGPANELAQSIGIPAPIGSAGDIVLSGNVPPRPEIPIRRRHYGTSAKISPHPKVRKPYYSYCDPTHGRRPIVNEEPYDAMYFQDYGTNPFVLTKDDHLSTFAIDVDDASYVMTRSYLERGSLPPDDAVRVEEFVNRFHYNYGRSDESPFGVFIEGAPSIFGKNSQLLKIGIQGESVGHWQRKPANLVFVIDVSGSMKAENRLGLVKQALNMMVDNLEYNDRVGIIVYGTQAHEILPMTSVEESRKIHNAIGWLRPTGSTNAEQGLRMGFRMADRAFRKGYINRVILCSDGVANVGQTNADELLRWIKQYVDRGITLSTIGFGMGNYNDILMEKLGDKGNGNYAYVDDFSEAKRVFKENLTGMLQVIARDVKIQVDFNPNVVSSYRLLGFENRDVADNKFRDDREDGGEIGSGHQVTALYEVNFIRQSRNDHVASVYIRYKHPDRDIVDEQHFTVKRSHFRRRFSDSSSDFKLAAAAAEFGEILAKSFWARDGKLRDVRKLVRDVMRQNDSREVVELMELISKAERYEDQLAER